MSEISDTDVIGLREKSMDLASERVAPFGDKLDGRRVDVFTRGPGLTFMLEWA